jgi:uncharacterized damage-inducible protein DinB
MTIGESLLAEFEQEVVATRKFLERLPEDKLTWKPHEKSKTAGDLALHIAQIPGMFAAAALEDEWSPPAGAHSQPANKKEILDALDKSVEAVRKSLPRIEDARMPGKWRFLMNGQEIIAMPRIAMLRSIMLNHWYHHRGQLGVYLRLLGCQVPSSYGPSGDEMPDFMKKGN